MSDPFRLERFVRAQDDQDTFARALAELRSGCKEGHWMWFVFPQVAGLGRSSTAQMFAISGLPEAEAYVAHPILGPRLIESAQALGEVSGRTAEEIFGRTDAMKLRSSMTLFARAAPGEPSFRHVLDQYFHGAADDLTESLIDGR